MRSLLATIAGTALLVGLALTPAHAGIRPDPTRADADKPAGYKNGCHLNQNATTPKGCVYGDKKARRTITLVGDSKARQWLPTLDQYGKKQKWRIVAHTKSACSFSQADLPLPGSSKRYTSCLSWNDKVLTRLKKDTPDVVVVSLYNKYARKTAAAPTAAKRQAAMARGLRSSWRTATRAGATVVVLNSTPYIGRPYAGHRSWEAPDCVAAHRADPLSCDVPAAPALSARSVWDDADRARVLGGMKQVSLVDLNPVLCSSETCAVTLGTSPHRTMIYRDTHHLTATAARALYPSLRGLLDPLI